MGTSVGRRFGNAVRRNRAKRIIRELYRTRKEIFPVGIDIVFMPAKGFLDRSWRGQQDIFGKAARKIARALRQKKEIDSEPG